MNLLSLELIWKCAVVIFILPQMGVFSFAPEKKEFHEASVALHCLQNYLLIFSSQSKKARSFTVVNPRFFGGALLQIFFCVWMLSLATGVSES